MFRSDISVSVQRVGVVADETVELAKGAHSSVRCHVGYIIIINDIPYTIEDPNNIQDISIVGDYLVMLWRYVTHDSCIITHDELCPMSCMDMTSYEASFLAEDGLCKCGFAEYAKLARVMGLLVFDNPCGLHSDGYVKLQTFASDTKIHYCFDGKNIGYVTVAGLVDSVIYAIRSEYIKK